MSAGKQPVYGEIFHEVITMDKYAMERGGWSTPNTLKNVYQHTFSEERKQVDKKIDDYFNGILRV